MSLANYHVGALWGRFMPRRKEIAGTISSDLISMAVYGPNHFLNFDPCREFEKWAACEVKSFDSLPAEMETFIIPEGLYAVFHYKGLNTDFGIYDYIFKSWLPDSGYQLDERPHFEILGEKYRNNDMNSEEEIWIPIKA